MTSNPHTHLVARLRRIAGRLERDTDDSRHTVLDLADDFLTTVADLPAIPERLRVEVDELREELQDVRPRFASHRTSSTLFDREGLGVTGRQRARTLAQRMSAVAKSLARSLETA